MSKTIRRKNDFFHHVCYRAESLLNEEKALFNELGDRNIFIKKRMAQFRSDNDSRVLSAPKWFRQSRTKGRRTNLKKTLLQKVVKGEIDDIVDPGYKKDSSDYF